MRPSALPDLFRLSQHSYETEDELHFLRYLGKWTRAEGSNRVPRATLLQRYQESMLMRQDWGDVDPLVIECAVIDAIVDLQ